jgi:hypothetical protein
MCGETSAILVAVSADFFFDVRHLEVPTDVIVTQAGACYVINRRCQVSLRHSYTVAPLFRILLEVLMFAELFMEFPAFYLTLAVPRHALLWPGLVRL